MRHPICQVQQAEVTATTNGLPALTLDLHNSVGFTFILTPDLALKIAAELLIRSGSAVRLKVHGSN